MGKVEFGLRVDIYVSSKHSSATDRSNNTFQNWKQWK